RTARRHVARPHRMADVPRDGSGARRDHVTENGPGRGCCNTSRPGPSNPRTPRMATQRPRLWSGFNDSWALSSGTASMEESQMLHAHELVKTYPGGIRALDKLSID